MNVYNPLDSRKRLEAAALDRRQAEATKGELDAALDRQTIKLGGFLGGMIALTTAILGVLISFK